MTPAEITRAIHNLTGVAQTCSYVEEAVHFYGTQKTALGEDITTVLDHVTQLERVVRIRTTPRTTLQEQVAAAQGVPGYVHASFARVLAGELEDLQKWKKEMLEVERQWDCQKLAKLLGATLGDNCRAVIQEQVTQLVENNRRQQLLIERLEKVILERNAQLTVLRKGLKEIEQLALSGIKDVAARQQAKAEDKVTS